MCVFPRVYNRKKNIYLPLNILKVLFFNLFESGMEIYYFRQTGSIDEKNIKKGTFL